MKSRKIRKSRLRKTQKGRGRSWLNCLGGKCTVNANAHKPRINRADKPRINKLIMTNNPMVYGKKSNVSNNFVMTKNPLVQNMSGSEGGNTPKSLSGEAAEEWAHGGPIPKPVVLTPKAQAEWNATR